MSVEHSIVVISYILMLKIYIYKQLIDIFIKFVCYIFILNHFYQQRIHIRILYYNKVFYFLNYL